MKHLFGGVAVLLCLTGAAMAAYEVSYNFNTEWTGDYAPGWENTAYRHGTAPTGKMMEFVYGGRDGTAGMRLVAAATASDSQFWVGVNPTGVDETAMLKQYDPWISAWYYDEGYNTEDSYNSNLHRAGQIFAVPSWVNPYIAPGEDWTDVQFGARTGKSDFYYQVAAGENGPGWLSTSIARVPGWHQLKMQLSSADGRIHFYLDGAAAGTSYRNDYVDLGAEVGLYTMFTNPLSDWTQNKPWTIWDDVKIGSSVPEPATMALLGLGALVLRRKA